MIRLEIQGSVAEIVLDAPERRNALSDDALAELGAAYREAETAGVRALLVRGEGPAFCAGRDLRGVDPTTDDVMDYLDGRLTPLMRQIASFPAPTFAAVQGACLGVGLGLALAHDVVYVASSGRVGSPFARLGAALDSGGHHLFVERLGSHRALDLIYTGDLMSGDEAVRAGLFSRTVPDDELLAFAREQVARVATGPAAAYRASKDLVSRIRDERLNLWQVLEREAVLQTELATTADYREGLAAFAEKRPPVFMERP